MIAAGGVCDRQNEGRKSPEESMLRNRRLADKAKQSEEMRGRQKKKEQEEKIDETLDNRRLNRNK